jgi:hypothetical protein
MNTGSLAKAACASTWTTAWISETPVSMMGFGDTVTWISVTGGVLPVPPPPPLPVLQAAVFLAALAWVAHHLVEPLGAAEATPAIPRSGMVTTTVSAVNRTKLRRTFICSLLVVRSPRHLHLWVGS